MRAISAKSLALAPYLEKGSCQLGRVLGYREMRRGVLLHVLPSRIAKHLRRPRCVRPPPRHPHHLPSRPTRILSVLVERLQTPRKHLLKAHDHHAIRHSMTDHVPRNMQACRAGRAVIVDIVDGNLRHAELVEDALAAGRIAVTVAGNTLFNIVIVDLGVEKGFDAGFEAEFGVVDCRETQRG